MNNREDAHKFRLSADLPRFFIVGAVFLALALFLRHEISGNTLFQIQELRARLLGDDIPGGLWMSGAIFLLSSGLLISLGIPRLWVCGVAGTVYGAGLGSLLALGGSLIGAITVYLLGRSLLAGMVQRRFAGHLASWGLLLQDNGFWLVFYSRLFPFTNSTVNSLLCGSCRSSLRSIPGRLLPGIHPLDPDLCQLRQRRKQRQHGSVVRWFCLTRGIFPVSQTDQKNFLPSFSNADKMRFPNGILKL